MPEFYVVLGISGSAFLSRFIPRRDCSAAEGLNSTVEHDDVLFAWHTRGKSGTAYEINSVYQQGSGIWHSTCEFKHENLIKVGK